MNKTEFLEALKGKLQEELSDVQVNGHIRYYEQYIQQEVQNGISEAEVISSLGDPVLLARTILETSGDSTSGYTQGDLYSEDNQNKETFRGVKLTSGWGCLLAAASVIVVLCVVLWLVGVIVSAVLPVVMPIILILFIITLFRKKR